MFGISTSGLVKGDPKVRKTVIYILYSHFTVRPDSVVIWICDGTDGKERIRNRKFNGWFLDCKDADYTKLDTEIVVDVGNGPSSTYVSVVHLISNPHSQEIALAFNNLEADFNDKDLSVQE